MGLFPWTAFSSVNTPHPARLLTPSLSFPPERTAVFKKSNPGRQLAFWDKGLWWYLLYGAGPWLGTGREVVVLWAPRHFRRGLCSLQPGGSLHERLVFH